MFTILLRYTYIRLTNSSDLLQQTQLQCKTADKRDCLKLQHSLLSVFQSVSQVLHLLAGLRLSFILGCHTWKHASPEAPQQRCCLETNWLEHAKMKKKKRGKLLRPDRHEKSFNVFCLISSHDCQLFACWLPIACSLAGLPFCCAVCARVCRGTAGLKRFLGYVAHGMEN